MNASGTTGLDAVVDFVAIDEVVLVEHTGGARHRQDEGIGRHDVGLQAVIVGVLTRVVVIDEGHRVALIVGVCSEALVVEGAPVATGEGVLQRILQREVEYGGLDAVILLGALEPPAQGLGIAVPVLAHREGRLAGLVVQAHIVAREALAQIDDQGYALPYTADKRKLFKIGVNFSSTEKNINEWEVE